MRVDDISCAKQVTSSHYTESMYVPRNTKYEDMTPEVLRRALCPKNMMRDWHMCQTCKSGCRAGNLLVSHMTGDIVRPAPVQVVKPKPQREKVRKPSATTFERVKAAREAICQGGDRNEVAQQYGYKKWDTLRDAMVRLNVELPPMVQDRSRYWAHIDRLRKEAVSKVLHARKLFAQGMTREEAARAAGYSRWDTVLSVYKKNKDEVDRRERV